MTNLVQDIDPYFAGLSCQQNRAKLIYWSLIPQPKKVKCIKQQVFLYILLSWVIFMEDHIPSRQ